MSANARDDDDEKEEEGCSVSVNAREEDNEECSVSVDAREEDDDEDDEEERLQRACEHARG